MSRLFPGKDHSVTSADARLDTPPREHRAAQLHRPDHRRAHRQPRMRPAGGPGRGRRGQGAIAAHAGFPQASGASQSPFALARGAVFETQVKANGAADLIRLLRGKLGLTLPEVSYADLEYVGGNTRPRRPVPADTRAAAARRPAP